MATVAARAAATAARRGHADGASALMNSSLREVTGPAANDGSSLAANAGSSSAGASGSSVSAAAAFRNATRAADLWRSSCSTLNRIRPMPMARISERAAMPTSRKSMVRSLPQPEFHRDLHQHVHRRTVPLGRRESPLPHRVDRALIESGAQAVQDANGADAAV